jgi:RNA polymerase sigma-70 factor (ECF subfamily)
MDDMRTRAPRPALDVGEIFEEHFAYVWNSLRRLGVRERDLEDLVHEVFLKIHVRAADYDPSRPVRPWVFGFALRVAADYRRLARHRVEVLGIATEPADAKPGADERAETNEKRELVQVALDSMDLDRRAVLLLHDIDGVPAPAIAEALGIPLNTAYSRLRLAREDLTAAVRRLRDSRGMT